MFDSISNVKLKSIYNFYPKNYLLDLGTYPPTTNLIPDVFPILINYLK